MKYMEMHELVLSEAGIYIQMGLSALKSMVWITEALHQYQVDTGVVRCTCDLILDPDNDDGHYDLGDDIDQIDKIEFYANEGAIPSPINLTDFDSFLRLQAQVNAPVVTQGFVTTQSIPYVNQQQTNAVLSGTLPSPYYATRYGDCELFFMPFKDTTGFLRIYYKPYFMPYTPSAEGRWKKFGNPPDATMRTENIPREFQAATEGIKGYAMTKILQQIPNHAKLFPGAWQSYKNDFAAGAEMIRKKHQSMSYNINPTPNMTGRLI